MNERVFRKVHRNAGDVLAADVLDAFGGRGVVRVLERPAEAVLLERLEPGMPLSALVKNGKDDEATRILARTILQMRAETVPDGVPTAADLGVSFARYLESGDRRLPEPLVRAAWRAYSDLCDSQTRVRLLHGDLHHDNVLFDTRRGWVAIDPKGVVGEVEYELGAALRNPADRPEVFGDPRVFGLRVDGFARELAVNRERVERWAFSTAVLAAIWTIEDGDDPGLRANWIAFAERLSI